MIRINLLGQARPKPTRRAVPLEATLQLLLLGLCLLFAVVVLYYDWYTNTKQVENLQKQIREKTIEKARLESLKQQVESFDRQKAVLQQRIAVIEELQRNRTGGQELLDTVATTVTRSDALWLTSLTRKGNALTMEGSAASINSVANFITQLKRSGYFQRVEIKESRQDERNTAVQTFVFTLMAEFSPPQGKPASPAPVRKG